MGRGNWYKKWVNNHSFIVENDRLKEKKYIFMPFPKCEMHGFLDGNVRPAILADFYSRYLRMRDKNVLMPIGFNTLSYRSFTESKRNNNLLDDSLSDIYRNTLEELGVGINESKLINTRHNEYVSNLQRAFIDLYEKGYIEYKITDVYFDEANNKIYDSLLLNGRKYPSIKEKCFVLKIDNFIKQIIADINSLNIKEEYKNKLIDLLEPKEVLALNFSLTNNKTIEIELDNIEYLGGASYILMNPEYVNIFDYVSEDEISGVTRYLENGDEPFAYSGINAINPLTGNQIPIFVSTAQNKPFYLGIPAASVEDNIFAKNAEFEIIEVLNEEGLLINSDFIDNLDLVSARNNIISAFVDCGIAIKKTMYNKKEIILSSNDNFGALFPFLYDKSGMTLNSLKDFLPYNFTDHFRPQLAPNVDLLGDPLDGSINNLFVEGMAPFISILYDEFNSDFQMFSDTAKNEFDLWMPIELLIINEKSIIEELLMPIIIHNILKKELGYNLSNLFNKIIILPSVCDNILNEINKSNNNLINIDKLLNDYYADSIRLYYLLENLNDKFVFNKYELEDIDKFVKYLLDAILKNNDNNTKNLDYYFAGFADEATRLLNDFKINEYIELVKNFSIQYVIKNIPSKDNILTFIRVVFPVMPYLSEEVYEKMFNGKYSIINEGWPL